MTKRVPCPACVPSVSLDTVKTVSLNTPPMGGYSGTDDDRHGFWATCPMDTTTGQLGGSKPI